MRVLALIAIIGTLAPLAQTADIKDKVTEEDRIELTRGLMAEYANAKVLLPRAKKGLEFDASNGTFDKKAWTAAAKEFGPAARTGDTIQITKIAIADDHLVLEINKGFNGGRKWYDGMQVTGAMGGTSTMGNNSNAPGGTSLLVLFHKSLAGVKAADVKKMLAPVLDFDRHSVTQLYSETLPPEVQQAIKDKKVVVGMDREQVRMALGQRTHMERYTKDGVDLEDWIYGQPPGKIVFITFDGEKVVKVKEDYAGLGTDVGSVKK